MESVEHQIDILANHEYDGKLQKVSKSESDQLEESKKNEGHRKVKVEFGYNIEIPQEHIQNYEADENEDNGTRSIIKLEKFECIDDILPQIAVEHYDPEQSKENQTNVLVKSELRCEKLENVPVSTIEESRKNEGHIKIKVDEFSQNVEAPQESKPNYEADEYERNGKGMTIKMFECSNDILPHITVDCYDPEQNINNRNNVLIKSKHCCDKLPQTSQVILNQPEEYEENQRNKDSKAVVARAVYEVSGGSNSSRKPYAKQTRRGGNLSEKENHKILNGVYEYERKSDKYKDTISSELTQDNDSKSVNVEASKVLVTDSQCYVALEKPSYKCDICRYVTFIKELLVSHMKLHNFNQSDSLSERKLQLKNQIISEKYEYKQISDKQFACDLCSYKSARKSALRNHILTHTGEKPFACNLCSFKTAQKYRLKRHKLTHTGDKPFACTVCSYKSGQKSNLQKHQLTHTGEMPFACNLCSYKSAHKSHLNEHILTHIVEKPFACNLCSYKSSWKFNLQTHQLKHTGEMPFACNICSYKFAHKSHLNQHKRTHTGEKPFACNLCSYKSARKTDLLKHQPTHTGEKPFACNLCSYKSAYKSHLNQHQLTHTGEKPFACNLCSYKSARQSNLYNHQFTHTGEKPFACNLCSYKSSSKSNLQNHQFTHTGEKRFACNLCLYKTVWKSSLRKHQLTHTG